MTGVLTPSISIALVIGSDQEEIYIDANFSGEELLVFGAFYSDPSQSRDSKSDILIEVVGPPEDVALRKKDSYFGFWLNSKSVTFRDVPGFYYLSSTSELTDEFFINNQIGLLEKKKSEMIDWSLLTTDWGSIINEKEKEEFYNALIRTKQNDSLYKQVSDEIENEVSTDIFIHQAVINMKLGMKCQQNSPFVNSYSSQLTLSTETLCTDTLLTT